MLACVILISELLKYLDNLAFVILWTVVECSLGIMAGSLPMLRSLFKGLLGENVSMHKHGGPNIQGANGVRLVTFGRIRARGQPAYDTELLATIGGCQEDMSNERDDSSTKRFVATSTSV